MKFAKIKCTEFGTIFVAYDTRHHMDDCPKCHIGWVDMETDYMRHNGKITFIEDFTPPWFDNENDYHSALLSWLNDSDSNYTLEKRKGILIVIKL